MGWFGAAKKKVLLVDDEAHLRAMVELALSEAGYEVDEAEDGRQAIEKLSSGNRYDLMICDYNMPNMTGIQVLEAIVAANLGKDMKVLMLTAESLTGVVNRAFELKATDYVIKPFDITVLMQKVAKLVPAK